MMANGRSRTGTRWRMQLKLNRFCFGIFRLCVVFLFLLPCMISCGTDNAAQKKKATTLADLGQAMATEGNLRGALQKLLEASKLDPDNADIYQQIALVFRSLGKYPLSLKYFRKALEVKPEFPKAVNNMGTVYLLMGDWPKAINCFKKAAENIKYQTPHYAYNNLGLAYFNMGDYEKAVQNYEMSIRLSRSYAFAYVNLAKVYEAKGDLDEAEVNYREAVLYRPRDPRVLLGFAELLIKEDKIKEAKETLIKVIKEDPRSTAGTEARRLLAKLQN